MRVLFVCTANVCRSPMAAGLFVEAVAARGITDAYAASAGFLEGGQPVHEHVADILNRRGIDTSRKRSQELSAGLVAKSDLILAMTTEHARGIVGRHPETLSRVYTFRHFGLLVEPRSEALSTSAWLDALNRDNKRADLRNDPLLDIPDPIGQDLVVFETLAEELANTTSWVMDCAYAAVLPETVNP